MVRAADRGLDPKSFSDRGLAYCFLFLEQAERTGVAVQEGGIAHRADFAVAEEPA